MKFCEEEFLNTLSEHSVSQGIEKYAFNLPPDYGLIISMANCFLIVCSFDS
jgi:hypothetical protein